jgi:hypothetical protein
MLWNEARLKVRVEKRWLEVVRSLSEKLNFSFGLYWSLNSWLPDC